MKTGIFRSENGIFDPPKIAFSRCVFTMNLKFSHPFLAPFTP
ncbi:hypothetical protein HAL013_06970 [Helicobacter ailurogastricus]|uniref:Uncharacterized protein n=1 Tax=Helicobacter ailurogastricus TaxID=1578720 RepID=A0A0K2XCQ6_9HELI|nr:hypothetical protein HAL011_07180 [Helicobacter ailurogastricus]CRF42509.1 hypothetical protein HAL013_06970 [Helicobacter ailurogastricus]CRF44185.1 hypothetical protein HAL09_07580 [Helicobacter ailurogastricus]